MTIAGKTMIKVISRGASCQQVVMKYLKKPWMCKERQGQERAVQLRPTSTRTRVSLRSPDPEQDNVFGTWSTDSQKFFSPLNHLCGKLGVFICAVKTKHILRFPIRHLVDPIVYSWANIVKWRRLICTLTLSDLNHSLVASLNPGISLGVTLSNIELIQNKFLHLSTSSMLLILSASGSLTSITTKIETSCSLSYRWSIIESDL